MKIAELVQKIKSGETTARAQVEQALQKARSTEEYHALLSLTEERALKRADEIDAQIKSGADAGVLAGVPFVVKDNYLAFGAPTTAASKMLENFDAPLQATVVEKLEAAGAICVGKSNLDAFAHGGSTENSAFGVTHNAVDKPRLPAVRAAARRLRRRSMSCRLRSAPTLAGRFASQPASTACTALSRPTD